MLTLLAQFGDSSFNPGTGYGAEVTSNAAAAGSAELIISNVIGAITVIAGLLLIMYFLWGAVDWIVSGGDSGKVASARNKMTQAVIGMILVVLSYGLIGLIGTVVGVNVLNLGEQLQKLTPAGSSSTPPPPTCAAAGSECRITCGGAVNLGKIDCPVSEFCCQTASGTECEVRGGTCAPNPGSCPGGTVPDFSMPVEQRKLAASHHKNYEKNLNS